MQLEIGHYEDGSWRRVGSLEGHVTPESVRAWASDNDSAPGQYGVRGSGGEELYMFRVEADGEIKSIEVLDLD